MCKDEIQVCNCNVIHHDIVRKVNEIMTEDSIIQEAAQLLKVFGDKTRMKILSALEISEMCVCDLACALNMTQSAISHQLRVLKGERLVKFRRDGKVVYYSLDDEHIGKIMNIAIEHVKEI